MDFSRFDADGPYGCPECAAPLAGGQRYCLQCGARCGAPRVDALAELGLVGVAPFGVQAAVAVEAAQPARSCVPRPLAVVLATLALTVGGALGATLHGPAALASAVEAAGPIVIVQASVPAPAVQPEPEPDPEPAPAADVPTAVADTPAASAPVAVAAATSPAPTPIPARGAPSGSPTPAPTPSGTPTPAPVADVEPTLPAVGHVWVLDLTAQDASVFADTTGAPYLAGTLVPQGTLLTSYRAVGASQLSNGVALLSGQAPNSATDADCPVPSDISPTTGVGCFYAPDVSTLPGQLTTAGKTWKAYVGALPNPCGAPPPDPLLPGFVAPRNAFAAFHGLGDPTGAACVPNEVEVGALEADLAAPSALSWIVPSACDSGVETPCVEGAPVGRAALDAFLARTIPAIQASEAYKKDGLIVVTFDVGPTADQPVGALLVGPSVRPGATVATKTDHYALLRTLQKLFSLTPTGHAADAETFGADVWAPTTTRP